MKYSITLTFLLVCYSAFAQGSTSNNAADSMGLADKLSIAISSFALAISATAFFFARHQESKTARGAVIKAFQGEKEAVAYVAYKVRSKRWNTRFRRKRFRQDVTTSLCLAWSLESADRAKAIIFDTLKEIKKQGFEDDIRDVLQKMHQQFIQYRDRFYPNNFNHRIQDLESLMAELEVGVEQKEMA